MNKPIQEGTPTVAVVPRRDFSARRLNEIVNHPEVRPWVADPSEGVLDLTAAARNRDNVLLMGEHGCCLCFKLMPGLYEVHTQILPEGRGRWALAFVKAGATWMFENTDAFEVVTRVPHGHPAARTLTVAAGMRLEGTRPDGCKFNGVVTPAEIYSLRIQDWLVRADHLIAVGRGVHEEMHRQAHAKGVTATPHEDDENHNRIVGATFNITLGGYVEKAVALYNRWAAMARHPLIQLVSVLPPVIRFDIGTMRLVNGKIEVTPNV